MGRIILRLDHVMADRKISLKDLADKVGITNVNLPKLKNGHISAIRSVPWKHYATNSTANQATSSNIHPTLTQILPRKASSHA